MFETIPSQRLPDLEEQTALAPGVVARFASPGLTLDRPSAVTVTFKSETAAFQNTLGVYQVGGEGRISQAKILIERVEQADADPRFPHARPGDGPVAAGDGFDLGALYGVEDFAAGTRFGFFVIADGATRNPSELFRSGKLVFESDGGRASIDDPTPDLIHIADDGTRTRVLGRIVHAAGPDAEALNAGGATQAVAGATRSGDGVVVAFEDKSSARSDRDFNDLVIKVDAEPTAPDALPDLDALVGNIGSTTLLANEGDGTGPVLVPSGVAGGVGSTLDLALGDVDGDGDLDAVLANIGANQLLLNDGSGSFAAGDLPGGTPGSRGVALGDLDGDGDLDAYVANDRSNADQLLVNQGGGADFAAFDIRATTRPSQFSQDVALGDMDGDGDLDAVVAVSGANRLLLNLGDPDGDGDLDAVVANGTSSAPDDSQILINLGDVDGDGAPDFSAAPLPGGAGSATDVALADLDGDGDLDAILTRGFSTADPGEDLLLVNQGDPDGDGIVDFSASELPGGARDSRAVALGDLDADGDVDALIVGRNDDLLLVNQDAGGAPGFVAVTVPDDGNGRAVALGDLDGDGTAPVTDPAGLPDLGTLVPSPASDVTVS